MLGQVKVEEKSNEITAIPKILRALELSGCIVTIDAMSLPCDIRAFAKASRQHWGVENNVHWLLDVVFKEDQNRSREGFAAQNLATLRRLALNVLKRDKSKCSMRLKVKKAGWNNDFRLSLLGISPE